MADNRENCLVFIHENDENYSLQDFTTSDAMLMWKDNLVNTYKAFLRIGGVVAVKRLKGEFAHGIDKENLRELGEICHGNLLPFKAYMLSEHEQLLVYDYMHKDSLYSCLHGKS